MPTQGGEGQPTLAELERQEEEEFRTGPLSVLTTSVKTGTPVIQHASAEVPEAFLQFLYSGRSSKRSSRSRATGLQE